MASATPRTRHARTLFSGLGGDYDRWSAVLSFGQDPRWRRFLVERCPVERGQHVLDVATGTGLGGAGGGPRPSGGPRGGGAPREPPPAATAAGSPVSTSLRRCSRAPAN